MVVGQANESDQEDDGAGHKDRRPVRTHLTEHCGQATVLLSDARISQRCEVYSNKGGSE